MLFQTNRPSLYVYNYVIKSDQIMNYHIIKKWFGRRLVNKRRVLTLGIKSLLQLVWRNIQWITSYNNTNRLIPYSSFLCSVFLILCLYSIIIYMYKCCKVSVEVYVYFMGRVLCYLLKLLLILFHVFGHHNFGYLQTVDNTFQYSRQPSVMTIQHEYVFSLVYFPVLYENIDQILPNK